MIIVAIAFILTAFLVEWFTRRYADLMREGRYLTSWERSEGE